MPRPARFGVHPAPEDALSAVADADLPDDLDAILPAQRRMTSRELVAVGHLCATHARPRAGNAGRAELDRLIGLVERFLALLGDAPREPWMADFGEFLRALCERFR